MANSQAMQNIFKIFDLDLSTSTEDFRRRYEEDFEVYLEKFPTDMAVEVFEKVKQDKHFRLVNQQQKIKKIINIYYSLQK